MPGFRGCGIGAKLMKALFKGLKEKGFEKTSLSVQKDNPAVRFYERLGYVQVDKKIGDGEHSDVLMIKNL